jgi:hypothetical protein
VGLAAPAGPLGFSLCLWPMAHRGLQGTWLPGVLSAGRQDLKLQDTRRYGALPCREIGSGAIRHVAHESPPLQGDRTWSCRTRSEPEPSLAERHDPDM